MQSPLRRIQSSSKREQRLQKYLKPGALARLRDARIHARSRCFITSNAESGVSSARADQFLHHPQASYLLEESPCFKVRCYGPCFPQRKKLVASKAFFMAIPQSNPSSPIPSIEALDTFPPASPVEILAVH